MAIKDKSTLTSEKNAAIADNTTGNITPAVDRPIRQDIIDSTLNLASTEPEQTVQGPVDFIGGFKIDGSTFSIAQNIVVVNSKSDLPTPLVGVITLAANTTYQLSGSINLGADRIDISNTGTAIIGIDRFKDGLVYTGTGALLTASKTFRCAEMNFTASSGDVLDLNGAGAETCVFTNSFIVSCDRIGEISNWRTTVFRSFSCVSTLNATDGRLLFSGTCTAFNMDNSLFQGNTAGTMIDFGTATFDRIQIPTGNRFVIPSGITGLKGAASNGNLTAAGRGIITNNIFEGAGTYLSGLDEQDTRFNYFANAGLEDSMNDSYVTLSSNATATTISAANTPALVAGTWVEQEANKFTTTAAGRSTYDGADDITVPVQARASIAPVSGSNINFSLYIAFNGTVVSVTQVKGRASSGDPVTISTFHQQSFTTNDYIELYVENNDNSTNLLVSDAAYIID